MTPFNDFDPYVNDAMKSWHCPGAALAVIKGDRVIHQNAYGLRDVENALPMTEDTRFALGSVTKSITAMTVALLVDDGLLEWDKPVREYIPEFILADAYATEHVTVRDLLSHRTGLPRHDFSAWRLDVRRDEFIKRMRHLEFSTSFREKFQYNNLMYTVAAYLVDTVSRQRWEDFVQQRIFTPLKMAASSLRPEPTQPGQINANSYRVDRDTDGQAKGLVRMPLGNHTEISPGAAGALFSTLADLIRWLKVHINQGRVDGAQFVSPDSLKQMHLPQTVIPGGGAAEALYGHSIAAYGFGWSIRPYQGRTLVSHTGGVEGQSTVIGFIPEENIGAIVLTNIGLLPLKEALLFEALDRVLNLSPRDWNAKIHEFFDPLLGAAAKGKQTAARERLKEAPPTHPSAAYEGTYKADGYPDFAVRRHGDQLEACTVGSLDWSPLRHYHFNVFEWHLADVDIWLKIRFLIDDNGAVDRVSVPLEPAVKDILFTRGQLALPAEIIESLIGEYVSPIEGIAFTATAGNGKVFITQTGGTPIEITPFKHTHDAVEFKAKRFRIEFLRADNAFDRLVVKTMHEILEARRKE